MADKDGFRGGRGGGAPGRGGRGGRGGGAQGQQQERKPRESVIDLSRFVDKRVAVKFNGGREVTGVLKGYDQLQNMVLDDVEELLRDDEDNESKRSLGLVVARFSLLTSVMPVDGVAEIANPYAAASAPPPQEQPVLPS